MPGVLDALGHTPVRMPGGVEAGRVVAYRGTTNASGDITLSTGSDYDGMLTAPSRSTNTYTLNIGPYKRLLAIIVRSGLGSATTAVTVDGAAGTVVYTLGATQVSTTHDVIVYVDRGYGS